MNRIMMSDQAMEELLYTDIEVREAIEIRLRGAQAYRRKTRTVAESQQLQTLRENEREGGFDEDRCSPLISPIPRPVQAYYSSGPGAIWMGVDADGELGLAG